MQVKTSDFTEAECTVSYIYICYKPSQKNVKKKKSLPGAVEYEHKKRELTFNIHIIGKRLKLSQQINKYKGSFHVYALF